MIKIEEDELKSVLDKVVNNSVKITFAGVINGDIIINKCIYKYNVRRGKVMILDKSNKNFFTIDIFPVYKIIRDENFTTLKLYTDYELEVKIERI